MSAQQLTILVDGGGSGSRLTLVAGSGERLAATESGPASLSLGIERAWQGIQTGIAVLARERNLGSNWLPDRLCMGLAGALQEQRRAEFLQQIPAHIQSTLVSDGQAQLIGASGGEPGICLAVGTGSVVHWLDSQRNHHMAGGWGFPVGDEGSGAWLGMAMLRRYLLHRDNVEGASVSPVFRHAIEQVVGTAVSDIQRWSTCKEPAQLASLVPVLVQLDKESDQTAIDLIDAGFQACQSLVACAPSHLPLYIVGGLFALYKKRFEAAYSARLQTPRGDVVDGLFTLVSAP